MGSSPLSSHKKYVAGKDAVRADDMNMILDAVRALWNMTVSPPLRIKKGRNHFAITLGAIPKPSGKMLLGVAKEDIPPRSLGKVLIEKPGHKEDKGEEPFGPDEEKDDVYNPFGFTIAYGSRLGYIDTGTTGLEIAWVDALEEWSTLNYPVFPKSIFEVPPK